MSSAIHPMPAESTPPISSNGHGMPIALVELGWLPIWLVTRIYMYLQHISRESHIVGDVNYYFHGASQTLAGQQALLEYPAPVAWLLTAMRLFSGNDAGRYVVIFVCSMAALDLLVSGLLWMRYSKIAALYWMVFLMLVGSLTWYRLDLLAAVPFLLALLWFGPVRWQSGLNAEQLARRGHPFAAGGAVAFGAAMKLWPALLIFPMLGLSPRARRRGLGFVLVGGALGLLALLGGGWQRSISPMTWQSDRGLHAESLWATGPMWRRTFGPDANQYRIEFSDFNAYEVFGPNTAWLAWLADLSMYAVVGCAVIFCWLIAFGGAGLPRHRARLASARDGSDGHWRATVLAVVALMFSTLAANKTFSPQYLIWFAGPLAVLATLRGTRMQRTAQLTLAALGLSIAGLTRWIYPLHYGQIIGAPDETGTRILVLRNVLVLVALALSLLLAALQAWRVGAQSAVKLEEFQHREPHIDAVRQSHAAAWHATPGKVRKTPSRRA